MICSWRTAVTGLLLVALIITCRLAIHYRDVYQVAIGRAESQQKTIEYMQERQQVAAALDAKYQGELADAKKQIDALQRDVADGRKRLHVAATCPSVLATTGTTGGADATGPRLTADAEQNYFRLREQIRTATTQINGLQDYIRQQCLNIHDK